MKRLPLLLSALFLLVLCPASRAGERVRLACDRSLYAAGETIWMRGWISDVDGDALTSKFLYVELLRDGVGGVERRVKLKERRGMFFGQLELPDDLESGWYTLRAYTRAQKDWPATALFHTRLLIRGVGPVPGIYAGTREIETLETEINAALVRAEDGRLAVTLTDAEGRPVPGNFCLSAVSARYADFDFQAAPATLPEAGEAFPEGPREYAQELDFRVKSVRNRLPEQYSVAIMSQDIGYYYSTEVPGDRAIKGEEGQSFRIPDLDFPEETLFSVNVTGSKFLYPAMENDEAAFAAPFDYGPTYPVREVIRDTAVIRERFTGTVAPAANADTIAAARVSAERKPAFYKHPRLVGPYSNLFEWRQVKLREDLKKYDDLDLLTYISAFFPGLYILGGGGGALRSMYTTRSASFRIKVSHGVMKVAAGFDPVELYIDGTRQEDWGEVSTFSVRNVQNLFVLRGAEAALYNASAVVLLETRRFDESMIEEAWRNERKNTIAILPLGWQQPRAFDAAPADKPERQGTLYWNPCVRTDAQGQAVLTLPDHLRDLPDGFYLRLEGQALDGRPFFFGQALREPR